MKQATYEELAARLRVAEDALRNSEGKYRTLTENITVGIFRSTPGPRGNFIEVNAAFVRMLGYNSKEELLATEVAQIYQDSSERLRYSEKISREGFVHREELNLHKKDGTAITVTETSIAVKRLDGSVEYFAGIIEDISERKKSEWEFHLQRTYLEKLFNSAPEAIALHDNSDRVVNVNEEFTRMFGYSREEAIGKPINDLIAPKELLDEAVQISERVIKGERVSLDTKRRRKDGTLVDVSILGSPIVHDDGTQIGDYAIYRDITEQRQNHEALLLQKAYFQQLFNSAPEAIVLHDVHDSIMDVNEEFTRMFGYTREEAVGRRINELVAHPDARDEACELSHRAVHGKRIEVDGQRVHKNGSLIDVSILCAPIIHNGTQMGVYAIYRNITERKRAEEELHIQKTHLERLFNSAPEAIIWHDNNDCIINVNEEFTRLFGYTREEAIGKPINSLVAPEGFENEAATLSGKVLSGERVEANSLRKRKDGTLVDVSILGAPIVGSGKQMGVFAIYRDITERKRAEEARIRLQEERRMSRDIQMNFLPDTNPEIHGYDIAGKSIPAQNVGGDYYDFIRLDEHRLAIGLGDVSGHGLAASLVMANVQATIRGQALFDAEPDKCLERANTLLFRSTDARTFISLFYGILDTRNHTMRYANAGQDLPIVFSAAKQPFILPTRGIALGLKGEVSYAGNEYALKRGEVLLIYSDGIPEAMNGQLQQFGVKQLQEIVHRRQHASAEQIIETIFSAVNQHVGAGAETDDMTVIVLKRL